MIHLLNFFSRDKLFYTNHKLSFLKNFPIGDNIFLQILITLIGMNYYNTKKEKKSKINLNKFNCFLNVYH